ncbi:hypothetical protein GH714_024883 [Hevea brasiliensis]|uniref:P-type H(+)-exporting transporter n=1 Tax=Hevea brasiliensis TaxID=3981 RepID=A0A6A6LPB5_HEVBR|nr:hypothetical protein GH714_024883 [Hevea brasiliensis]
MDVLCSDKTGTLTLNKLTVDKSLIEVFAKDVDKDSVILYGAMASRVENQDAIDACIVGMLGDPKEARAGITEVHFLPFNPVEKRTAITILTQKAIGTELAREHRSRDDAKKKAHAIIDKFADRGLRSLGVCRQTVPEKTKDSPGGPWQFVGLEWEPTCILLLSLGQNKDESIAALPVDELIEKADGFAGVFPEHKYEIVKRLQERKHICGMTGDGVNDAPALKKADIGIAVADATDAARGASDIVLTEPGLSVIVSAVLTSRAIFQRMKNYTIYAVSITIRIVLGFMLLALIWKFDFSPFMVLIIAILNDGTIMTISKDRVKPSPLPDSWKLKEIFATGIVLGTYLAVMTVEKFGVRSIRNNHDELTAAVYLQVSIVSQALIFVTRSRSWSFVERPGLLLVTAFVIAQLIATLIAVYAEWDFAKVNGIGWGWAGVIGSTALSSTSSRYSEVPHSICFEWQAWDNLVQNKTAFTTKKDYGRGEREAQWAAAQRTLHGLQPPETAELFQDKNYRELSEIAEQARGVQKCKVKRTSYT